jgi:hypothetical protein
MTLIWVFDMRVNASLKDVFELLGLSMFALEQPSQMDVQEGRAVKAIGKRGPGCRTSRLTYGRGKTNLDNILRIS